MAYQLVVAAAVLVIVVTADTRPTDDLTRAVTQHTGVVFAPYVKSWNVDGTIPNWKNYSFNDIKFMLNLTATKFSHVTTISMGAGRVNESWETGDVAGLIPVAAANLNFAKASKLISLTVGFWHSSTLPLLEKEFENGLAATQEANGIFPETVWGLMLTSMTWMDYYRSWKDVVEVLKQYRPTANVSGLKLGLRLDICEQIAPKKVPADGIDFLSPAIGKGTDTTGELANDIHQIARNADFLHCVLMPPANTVGNGVAATVEALGVKMLEQERAFKQVNPEISVAWETGWPSAGVSRFGSINTVRNLQLFWLEMNKWTVEHNRTVYMMEAIDQPWKTNPNSPKVPTDPEGPKGGESHFGWWYLDGNQNIESIKEKIPEPELSSFSIMALAGIVLGALVIIIALLLWRLSVAKKQIDRLTEQEIQEFFNGTKIARKVNQSDSVQNALCLAYDQSFELAKDSIEIDQMELLGEGAFGAVYKGRIRGIEDAVAFKKPNGTVSAKQLKNLLTEIKIMIYIGRHDNILRLIGAHTQGLRDGELYIASECCSLGSLEGHLRSIPKTFLVVDPSSQKEYEENNSELRFDPRYVNHFGKPIGNQYSNAPSAQYQKPPSASFLRWAYEIANGMHYLGTKKIVHADLATRNVLLTAEGVAKISDFGLSRRLYEYTQYVKSSQEPLPWRWMAIESLRLMSFSTFSDVWAYGVLLWEIFSLGDMPFPGLSWNVDFVSDLEQGLRMSKPKYATEEIYSQMVQCWYPEPKRRPDFAQLRGYFKTSYEKLELELV